jgi:hypothetical protein
MCRVMCKTFWYRARLVSWLEFSVVVASCAAVALQMAEVRSCFGAVYSNTARLAASMVLEHSTRLFFSFSCFL